VVVEAGPGAVRVEVLGEMPQEHDYFPCVPALNEYVVFGSKDKSWSFHNLFQGVKLAQFSDSDEIHSVSFHPDGLLMASGLRQNLVKIWDMRNQQTVI